MGTVHAKTLDSETFPAMVAHQGIPPPPPDGKRGHVLVLDNQKAKVEHIYIEGLSKTKSDVVTNIAKDVLQAESIQDVIRKSTEARAKMEKLGIFKNVGILIDTNKGPKAHPDGLNVTFEVKEMRSVTGGIHTLVGNNEGSLVVGVKMPNVFGRAEKLVSEYSYGSRKSTSYQASFIKPIQADLDKCITASGFKMMADYLPSGYKQTDKGISLDLSFPSFIGRQSLRWEGVWRELSCLRTSSFAVREEAGHTLKSCLKHTYTRDTRDENVLPSSGYLLKLNQELAGYTGGDIKFFKEEMELQLNQKLFWDIVVSCSLSGGMLKPLEKTKSNILDRFFLGGPNSVRGFMLRGIGPHQDGDAVGSEAYWATGLHVYSPLPFNPAKGGFGDLFRTHFFVNAGNLTTINLDDPWNKNKDKKLENFRWSYGVGLVVRFGRIARMELNYCVPMRAANSDKISEGFQFGIGVNFL
ncbi:sorting and assembly machinery component 50 homolog A-like [Saccoglossus kowalevskii]|uniref:Sorting and assembly machinery component 50 homolog A-like n=1 Tax=Saccoglossus kowalevskii TaxID=10224 RepID=A0ABM0MGM1_SACKO|nr:PREDICTED: sorting and assembly machinery component 50 homolog A-like [Saccoglossus kowalevskii]